MDSDWVPENLDQDATMMGGVTMDGDFLDIGDLPMMRQRNALHSSDDRQVNRLGDFVSTSPNDVACMGGLLVGIMIGLRHSLLAQSTLDTIIRVAGDLGPLADIVNDVTEP